MSMAMLIRGRTYCSGAEPVPASVPRTLVPIISHRRQSAPSVREQVVSSPDEHIGERSRPSSAPSRHRHLNRKNPSQSRKLPRPYRPQEQSLVSTFVADAQVSAMKRIAVALRKQRERELDLQKEIVAKQRSMMDALELRRQRFRPESTVKPPRPLPRPAPASASSRPTRICIIGAGPVGLFTAILICMKHGRLLANSNGELKFVRSPAFPIIHVFERRSGKEWGRRTQTIVIHHATHAMLSRVIPSVDNDVLPSCPINALERRFRPFLERTLGVHVEHRNVQGNREMLDMGADCVIWAGGRGSPSPGVRERLGMQVSVGRSENALIFTFLKGGDAADTGTVERLAECVHLVPNPSNLRILVRPPSTSSSSRGRLWIIGIHNDLFERGTACDEQDRHGTMVQAWAAARVGTGSDRKGHVAAVRQILADMEGRVGPMPCSLHKLAAAHFKSKRATAYVEADYDDVKQHVPIVLVGDAAFGKPFSTGTTLNNHLLDANLLVSKTEWTRDNLSHTGHRAFAAYDQNYLSRVSAPRFNPR